MSTPGIQTTSHTPPTYFLDRTSSNSTLPDGLNHALNQENIRLQQIVYEHKVSFDLESLWRFSNFLKQQKLPSRVGLLLGAINNSKTWSSQQKFHRQMSLIVVDRKKLFKSAELARTLPNNSSATFTMIYCVLVFFIFSFDFLSLKKKLFSENFTIWDYRFWRTIHVNAMATRRIKMSPTISRMKWWEELLYFLLLTSSNLSSSSTASGDWLQLWKFKLLLGSHRWS